MLWAQRQEAWLSPWPQTDPSFSTIFFTHCVTKSLTFLNLTFPSEKRGDNTPCGGWCRPNVAAYAEHVRVRCLVQSERYAEPSIHGMPRLDWLFAFCFFFGCATWHAGVLVT